ncbi:hypothetical protein HPB47_013348 [Ixodes persulcatus]|uniref:Uncharacterized protein n=1 Tax=Ixodes persulcatus TaxID=34615 RepID=A0AC60QYP8_IXOPE|nr:hypothetical protein HPB47_013348 [Ixodes persulcatus]
MDVRMVFDEENIDNDKAYQHKFEGSEMRKPQLRVADDGHHIIRPSLPGCVNPFLPGGQGLSFGNAPLSSRPCECTQICFSEPAGPRVAGWAVTVGLG